MSTKDYEQGGVAPLPGEHPHLCVLREIAGDAMFTVHRMEIAAGDEGVTLLTCREMNALRWSALEAHFEAGDWPPFNALVAVSQTDQKAWGAIPDNWRDALEADGVHPQAEIVGRFERGLNFIRRRIEPLTPDYWLAEEAQLLRRALDAPDRDVALQAGIELGELRERAHLHGLHLRGVTQARARKAQARDAGAEGTEKIQRRAEDWKRRALELAQELRKRRPDLKSASAAAELIARTLAREGCVSARGKEPPGVGAIRRVIATLYRKAV